MSCCPAYHRTHCRTASRYLRLRDRIDWKIRTPIPAAHLVPSLVQSAICTNDHVLGVCWINPQTVVIYVFVFFRNAIEALTPVDTYVQVSMLYTVFTRVGCAMSST